MPIHMRRVGIDHALVLDTKTDKSHLIHSAKPNDYLFTFNSSGEGMTPSGDIVCRVRHSGDNLVVKNDLGIVTTPVPLSHRECYFIAEADFLGQWLVLQYEGAAP